MKIDIFTHFFPKAFREKYITAGMKDIGKRVQNVPTIADLDARFRVMDEFGEYTQVLSIPAPPLEAMAPPDRSPGLAQVANDGFAELCRKYPDRFIAFIAALPMNNPDAAVQEMDRAITQLGARGIQIFTNVEGKPLDLPEFTPIFENAVKHDLPVWIHPARGAEVSDYPRTEAKSKYEIWWTFGWPYETSAAMSRLVFSRIFDRLPKLKIVTHHMGGMIPYFEGRVGYGWDVLGSRTSDEDYVSLRQSMPKRPVEYFKLFYADTALFGAHAATKCGLDFFGPDHVVFASDVPFEPRPGLYIRETIRIIENLGLSDGDRDKIYRGNAERLMNLKRKS
jgi:predicted TIM-barrel fold metal-dependent hydrolase